MLLFSCKSKEIYLAPEMINNTEIIRIECSDNKDIICTNKVFGLTKVYDSEFDFKIEHLGKTIFKANENGKTFIYEVFATNYLLISDIPRPNNFASPFGNGKVFFLCDLQKNVTYRFSIGNYKLYPFKPIRPIHTTGTKAAAFIKQIDIEKREISLLFYDLKTEEKFSLQIITF